MTTPEDIKSAIVAGMKTRKLTHKTMQTLTGMPRSTWAYRMANPTTLTVGEICLIERALKSQIINKE